jgi:hypothetical protein
MKFVVQCAASLRIKSYKRLKTFNEEEKKTN